jgi:hypothetical protein
MNIDGKELKITPSSFDEAMDLKDAIESAVKEGKISIAGNFLEKDISENDFSDILNAILAVDCSKEIRKCLFICAGRAVLGTEKITKEFFEDIENRKYYYQIMIEVLKVNLSPFFAKIFSEFSGIKGKIKNILESK